MPPYHALVRHYEACLREHGPTHKGVDWPNAEDLAVRFDVMLDVMGSGAGSRTGTWPELIDLGCGPGLLLDHLAQRPQRIRYRGIDLSEAMIAAARTRHPEAEFSVQDVLRDPLPPLCADYVVMNGVLTEKRELSFADMEDFAVCMATAAFAMARKGIAFNVMSSHVDWEREDLFHWPYDRMMAAIGALTRHTVIRADYGLREYTVYLYRMPWGS